MAESRFCPVACASASNRSTTRPSSSIAPPSRWRYCCANSGPCEAATPPRIPKASAMVRAIRGRGASCQTLRRRKSVAHVLFRDLVHGFGDLVGARLLAAPHDQHDGLGAGAGGVEADDLAHRERGPGGKLQRGDEPSLHPPGGFGLRLRSCVAAEQS